MPTFDTPEPISATVEIQAGRVWIRASDRTDTVVEVRPLDADLDADVETARQTEVEYAAGQLTVRAPKHRLRSLFGRPPTIEVRVDLPNGSRVDVGSMGDLHGEGRLGESVFNTGAGAIRVESAARLRARTAAGDVLVGRTDGPADISTAAGRIRVGEIGGTATAKTSSGDIAVGEVTGDARLNTASGDVTVDRALAGITAKTAYGSVRVGEVARGSAVLESGFGEVEFGIAHGTAAWLDVDTKYGTVRSDLDAAEGPGKADETVEVRARTNFGDIVVRRA